MEVLHTNDHATGKELDHFLTEVLVLSNMKSQVTSRHEIHHQVQILSILKSKYHVNEEGMLQLR